MKEATMASINRVAAGWRARYRTPDGRSRSRTFKRKVDAERFLTSIEHDKLLGAYVDPRAGRVTFAEYAEKWRAVQVWRPSTAAAVESSLRQHALPRFGTRPLGSIRPSEVQAWIRELADTLAPATVRLALRFFSAAMRAAVTDRVIASSPCLGVKLPEIERARVTPLETESIQALVQAMPARYKALILLGAGTGLRQGEAFGLTVDRIDFLRRVLTVDRQLVTTRGAPKLAPPKTAASQRTVPLPQVVLDAVAAHLAEYPSNADALVFTNERGKPIRRSVFSRVWRPSVDAAGVPAGTTFHDLRHYYASLLIRHGESVKVVQMRLGHASGAETLDTYSHLWPDSEDRTRAAVDSVLGAPAEPATRALR
jgi:integrase